MRSIFIMNLQQCLYCRNAIWLKNGLKTPVRGEKKYYSHQQNERVGSKWLSWSHWTCIWCRHQPDLSVQDLIRRPNFPINSLTTVCIITVPANGKSKDAVTTEYEAAQSYRAFCFLQISASCWPAASLDPRAAHQAGNWISIIAINRVTPSEIKIVLNSALLYLITRITPK